MVLPGRDEAAGAEEQPMRSEAAIDVTSVPAYRWRCSECGVDELAESETEAVALGRRHLAWTHPAPTELQLEAARRTAS